MNTKLWIWVLCGVALLSLSAQAHQTLSDVEVVASPTGADSLSLFVPSAVLRGDELTARQSGSLGETLNAPVIKGDTPLKERERLFNAYRTGEIKCLVVSKVANFSIDLPDATIAIQVSGTFGSRQEEAQRLGRILRPKSDGRGATFYSIVSRDTVDQDFAQNRQRFLAEQGYSYKIIDADDVFQGKI